MSQTLLRSPPVLFVPEKQPARTGGERLTVVSDYEPSGDQPAAIRELTAGVQQGERDQVLLGVTGSGKTFTMAKVIEAVQKPTLILAPNKTLAAQLYGEMKSFFPNNAVEYFVSYYDYYQPEAYVPRTDTYIEKDAQINEQIDRMRHAATQSLLERNDVVLVASVSCIYGIGSVETYAKMVVKLETGGLIERDRLAKALVELQYRRNDAAFQRGTFRMRGETIDIFPSHYEDRAWRVMLFGDEIEIDPGVRSADRREDGTAGPDHDLRQQPLRDAAPDARPGDPRHQDRAEGTTGRAHGGGKAAGSRAPATAHDVRYRDDGDDRLLQRHRELFALSVGPASRRPAADAVRIPARERAADRGREPRHRAADRRHAARRLCAQVDPVRVRLPASLLHRQPPAQVRGMGAVPAADLVRQRDTGAVGDGAHGGRVRRAGDPADRPDRPGYGRAACGAAGGRPARGVPRDHARGRACS